MAGTKEGGKKAAAKNLARNPNFYSEIGHKGGKAIKSSPAGFAAMDREKVREAGRKGGTISRRRPKNG